MKHGDHGSHVRKLQDKLVNLGYPLPRYGPDGDFGDETIRAAFDCITDLWPNISVEEYIDADYVGVPDDVVEAIMDAPLPARPDWLHDVTMKHPIRNAYSYRRKLSRIDSITLHQTACNLSERLARWYFIQAQVGVTRLGKVILINTLDVISHHGNWFNHRSVGVEISGNFRGVEDKAWTLWKKGGRRKTMLPAQTEGARNACRLICGEVAKGGGKVTTIFAHRQANENKRGDPGEDIWKKVGMWAQEELGLTNDVDYTKGSGLPIPNVWDERSSHKY